jgi:tetratricopeptide (TPR) repeat protein
MAKSRKFALRALELDDSLAEAYTALALVKVLYDWDWDGARHDLAKAQALNPGYAYTHVLNALGLSLMGEREEALAEAKVAHDLDPLSVHGYVRLGRFYELLGNDSTALDYYRKAVELDGSYHTAHLLIGLLHCNAGNIREAMEALNRAKALSPDNSIVVANIAYCHALSGHRDEARALRTELETRSKVEYVSPMLASPGARVHRSGSQVRAAAFRSALPEPARPHGTSKTAVSGDEMHRL